MVLYSLHPNLPMPLPRMRASASTTKAARTRGHLSSSFFFLSFCSFLFFFFCSFFFFWFLKIEEMPADTENNATAAASACAGAGT